jgi:hypothetical protein
MAEESKARWVVLLQKAPRGPLTRDEVRALIDQGLLRMNDLAMEITDPESGAARTKADWKLLWQFPEFNRRIGERRKPDTPDAAIPAGAEKRQRSDRRAPELSPEEQRRRILEDLPPEIAAISPSDLAMRSLKAPIRTPSEEEVRSTPTPESKEASPAPRWSRLAAISGGAVAAVLVIGVLATRAPRPAPTAPSNARESASASAPSPRAGRAGLSRAPSRIVRPPTHRLSTGLPTGGELRPFDISTVRRAPPPLPAVSPVAREPQDNFDGEYVAPARRPRILRPGAPLPVERAADDGEDDDPDRPVVPRRPARVLRPQVSVEDDEGVEPQEHDDASPENGDEP